MDDQNKAIVSENIRFRVMDGIILAACVLLIPFVISSILEMIVWGNYSSILFLIFWTALVVWGLQVKISKFKRLKSNKAFRNLIITIFILWFIIAIPIFLTSIRDYRMINEVKHETTVANSDLEDKWVKVISPKEKFTVNLPSNWNIETDESRPGKIETYSYTATDTGGVTYIVKYENYKPVFDKEGIQSLEESQRLNFLKDLADLQVKELQVTNFSSTFIKTHNYDAIKYQGRVMDQGESRDLEGIMILADKISYSIVTLSKSGQENNIEKVLNSLVIN